MSREQSEYNRYIGDFVECDNYRDREEQKQVLYESGYCSSRVDDEVLGFGLIITGYRRVNR